MWEKIKIWLGFAIVKKHSSLEDLELAKAFAETHQPPVVEVAVIETVAKAKRGRKPK